MEYSIYLITAIVGCTLLGIQIVMLLIGLQGDHDVDAADADVSHDMDHAADHDGHGNVFFKILSLKALCAFTGLFGLTGLALWEVESQAIRLGAASGVGLASLFVVAWLMKGMTRLAASGTVNVRNAVGKAGSVYLRVPGKGEGAGKVTVEIQGRSMEFAAISDGEEIKTGTRVVVAEVLGDSTLKVVPL
jgi:hypothetical protein